MMVLRAVAEVGPTRRPFWRSVCVRGVCGLCDLRACCDALRLIVLLEGCTDGQKDESMDGWMERSDSDCVRRVTPQRRPSCIFRSLHVLEPPVFSSSRIHSPLTCFVCQTNEAQMTRAAGALAHGHPARAQKFRAPAVPRFVHLIRLAATRSFAESCMTAGLNISATQTEIKAMPGEYRTSRENLKFKLLIGSQCSRNFAEPSGPFAKRLSGQCHFRRSASSRPSCRRTVE